jgi:predicted nucleic acid-binding protein
MRNSACTKVSRSFGDFSDFRPFPQGFSEEIRRPAEFRASAHRLAHDLAPEAIEEFLAESATWIEPVEVHFQWRPWSRDPNDEMVLEAAIDGQAGALVTYDIAGPLDSSRIHACACSVLTWLDAQSVESLYLATVSPDNFLVLILFFVRDLIQSPWRTLRPMP